MYSIVGMGFEVRAVYEQFVRDRITKLRENKGVSEYELSYYLGKNRSYMYNISSGRALPRLKELFEIIGYFGMTPAEFFDEQTPRSTMMYEAISGMKNLTDDDIEAVLGVIGRLCVMRAALDDVKGDNEKDKDTSVKFKKTVKRT